MEDALLSMETTTEMESLYNMYGFDGVAEPKTDISTSFATPSLPSLDSSSVADIEVRLRPLKRLPPDTRYMFQRYGDCLDALDAQFDLLMRRLLAQAASVATGLSDSDSVGLSLTAPDEASHEPCLLIGRVVPPSAAASSASTSIAATSSTAASTVEVDGRLAPPALLLECPSSSGAAIVSVDLTGCSNGSGSRYSLFPGQVIGVRGSNPTGKLFLADAVLTPSPPPPVELKPAGQASLDLALASGPFDTDSLAALLRACAGGRDRPHVLLITGPGWRRITSAASGSVDPNMESAAKFCQQRGVQLVIQAPPGPVYPAPELASPGHGAICVPDPAQLLVETSGHQLAFTGIDTVAHLAAEEVSGGGGSDAQDGASGDRLSRLAGHMLSQASIYPLLPSHDSLPLDYPLWGEHCSLGDQTPHLLVAASQVKPFISLLPAGASDSTSQPRCCFVNPGRLARGTYARVRLAADGRLADAQIMRL